MNLHVQQLTRHYGGVKALDGVRFEVSAGQCVALIGPNGAGKSTCFACLAGQQWPDAGQVFWQGRDVTSLPPAQRQALGMARTFQVAQTFEALTVLQNLQLVLAGQRLSWWDRLAGREAAAALLALAQVGLSDLADAVVADLPYGAKKRLELAMALAGLPEQGERLLLLDEPAAGLAPAERADMMALVRRVVSSGVTVLYTEHNMDAVFGVADRVLVLMEGRLVADGTPEAVAHDPQVRERYLGQDFEWASVPVTARSEATRQSKPEGSPRFARDDKHEARDDKNEARDDKASLPVTARRAAPRQSLLTVEALNAWWGHAQALFDVNLQVDEGELVVLQGLNGAGKSTLLQSLIGIGPRVQGRIVWDGQEMAAWPAHRRARAGLGFVPEDRRLFTGLSVQDNLWIAAHAAGQGRPAQRMERVLALFPQLHPMLARPASQMSGGEQQMLALARTLMSGPRLLLLDEPCEGIAPVLVAAMRDALLQLAHEGLTLLVAEQNDILAAHAHRVLALTGGRLPAQASPRAARSAMIT
jgi:branched-chain amino acid transport system ATP-binding protein